MWRCILSIVRSRSFVGVILGLALAARATGARADWEVHRSSARPAREQAERALNEHPADAALARRLVTLAGKSGAAALRARFEARAVAPKAAFADVAAFATLLEAQGAFEDAATEFARAATLRPALAVLLGHARCLARAGRHADAVGAYDAVLAHVADARARRPILEAQVALLDERADLERELAIRRELAAAAPRSDEALFRVVDVLERLARPGEAADLLEARRTKSGALSFEDALRVAELRDAAGQGAQAADALATLIRQTPRSATERLRLAWARAVTVARRRDALPALAAALARAPGPVELDVLGQVREELGDLEGALAATRAAAHARPSAELGRRIITLLDRLGREDEAVAVYEDRARLEAGDPKWSLELVDRELRQGRRREAGVALDRAAAHFARSPSATLQLAELAARWGDDARALAAWERVRKLAPHDEQGILGLGELQFSGGKRALALRTWQALRGRGGVAGRLRLGEVLLEHELLDEATAEAQAVRGVAPRQPAVHRLLAQIFERQHRDDDAVRAWETVASLARGADGATERREARTRILTILAHEGRGRLDERVRALEAQVRKSPADREAALFLAEGQQRLGDQAGAIATLRGIIERDTTAGGATDDAAPGESTDDVTLALVRLLRSSGQPDEAVRLLEAFAARSPARAREAHVQIADLELARHDEPDALVHAQEAARLGPGDGQALARIAAIEERAGDEAEATETYRRAFERDAEPTAGFALARLLERGGDLAGAARVLGHMLETATDDEVILEAGRRSIDVEEILGRLPTLEQTVAHALDAGPRAALIRRVYVDVLRRLVPPLYRAGDNGPPSTDRARVAQHGLRPVLDLVSDADGQPERSLVELLGMLGNKDAAPVLARLAAPATDPQRDDRPASPAPLAREAQSAAVVALGRLADERGREVLEKLVGAPEAPLRAAAVWALGRAGGPRANSLLTQALRDGRADVVAVACLGIGRARAPEAVGVLAAVAMDVGRPVVVRRAAITGLALAGDRAASPTLLALADSGDDALERSALLALGVLRDRRTLPALLSRALLPRAPSRDGAAAVLALDLWTSDAPLADEATAIEGNAIDVEALLTAFVPRPSGTDLGTLWRDDVRALAGSLADALSHPGEARARALAALDSREDGVGLEPLVPRNGTLPPATTAALGDLGAGTRDAVAALLDDAAPSVRGAALSILSKAGDERVTARRVALAAAGPPAPRDAAIAIGRLWATTSPVAARALADALASALGAPVDGRLGVVATLGALGTPGVEPLGRALVDSSPLVRAAAADALAGAATATPALVTAATDPTAAVRAACARALRDRNEPAARAALERLARDEAPLVRESATRAAGPDARGR
jgi:tetratricopeptide (TPR) repeat protein/HEAT repeat protein